MFLLRNYKVLNIQNHFYKINSQLHYKKYISPSNYDNRYHDISNIFKDNKMIKNPINDNLNNNTPRTNLKYYKINSVNDDDNQRYFKYGMKIGMYALIIAEFKIFGLIIVVIDLNNINKENTS